MAGGGAIAFVDAKIKQRPVMLFSKTHSPDCKEIKSILKQYSMSPHVCEITEIDARQDCTQIDNYFQTICLTDRREVPQLFVRSRYIGGAREIVRLHASGELENVFQEAEVEYKLIKS
ncbi:glutaredoxin-like [Tubulanus polymorphus]|uniref:glutaredoxin-like n=1 Tax=Tubulanus polymorphus TaxID=672921 RepID=UPI003DA39DB8